MYTYAIRDGVSFWKVYSSPSVRPFTTLLTRAQFTEHHTAAGLQQPLPVSFIYKQTPALNSTAMASLVNDADYAKFLDLYKRSLIPLRVCRECSALIFQSSIISYRMTCSPSAIGGPLWLLYVLLPMLLSNYSLPDKVITLPDEVGCYSTLPKQDSNIFFRSSTFGYAIH